MKNFVHEIHRRSLWQVLGIYLAVSWIVLQVIDVVGANFGLPDWVAPAALVLLLLGLPVVIATAFVQEGLSAKAPAPPPQSLADVGEVEPLPAPEPSGGQGFLTWKNAVIGGGAAFALLGLLTAGYLFMRASGIGPAGTLVAQGVLEEGAEVLLAEFESPDPDLADVVTGALRIDLVQSPTIHVVLTSELTGALQRMQRDEDTPITGSVAREIAVREGYGAIIEGEIGTAGSGYVLTASIVGGEAWAPLAAFRVTAKNDDGLINAIEKLSRDIRDKAGESLRSVQNSPGLEEVSTSSLEALRLYTRGEAVENSDQMAGVDLFEQAVRIDPNFAMAHRKIGVGLTNAGVRRDDAVAALARAVELRDRLPAAEGYLAEGFYNAAVLGDRQATIRAYERLLEVDPENRAGLNNLALRYWDVGRPEDAEALLERALEVSEFTVAFTNLAEVRFDLGDHVAAQEVLDLAVDRMPGAAGRFENVRLRLAVDRHEFPLGDQLSAAFEERFRGVEELAVHSFNTALLEGVRGKLRVAGLRLDEAVGAPVFDAHPMRIARTRASLALVRGDSIAAVREILTAYESTRDSLSAADRIYGWWLPKLVEAGAVDEATRLYDEWKEEVPDDQLGLVGRDGRRELDARLAVARGEYGDAIRLFEAHARECGPLCVQVARLGLAHLNEARGDVDAAIAQYELFANAEARSWGSTIDFEYLGPTLERLGELYDQTEDLDAAAQYYERFVTLWDEADSDLQPRVQAARARLAEIRGASE